MQSECVVNRVLSWERKNLKMSTPTSLNLTNVFFICWKVQGQVRWPGAGVAYGESRSWPTRWYGLQGEGDEGAESAERKVLSSRIKLASSRPLERKWDVSAMFSVPWRGLAASLERRGGIPQISPAGKVSPSSHRGRGGLFMTPPRLGQTGRKVRKKTCYWNNVGLLYITVNMCMKWHVECKNAIVCLHMLV